MASSFFWPATPCCLGLCREPSWRAGVLFGTSISLVAVFTVHLFLVSAVLAAVVVPTYLVVAKFEANYTKRLGQALGLAVGSTALLSSYWTVPFVLGRGSEAAVVGSTGPQLLAAYAAVPDPTVGLVPNLVGLYGFWAENTGRFTSMKAFVGAWPVVLLIVLVISGIGAYAAVRRKDNLAPWAVGLVLVAVVGLILEVGISHPLTAGFVQWLDATVPLYRGMRDAGKWAALLALVYSQLFGLGAAAILNWVRQLKVPAPQLEWLGAATIGLLLALPLYYGNGLLFGMHGEIRPSEYPAGWYAADQVLAADPHPGQTLFLPWHLYMSLDFVRNTNNVIASPAPSFFSVPVVISPDAGIPGVTSPADEAQAAVTQLVDAGSSANWASDLAKHDIKYVLLAHHFSEASRTWSSLPITARSSSTGTCCGAGRDNKQSHSSQSNCRCQRARSKPSQNTSRRFGPHVTAVGAFCNVQPSDSHDQTPKAVDHACHST